MSSARRRAEPRKSTKRRAPESAPRSRRTGALRARLRGRSRRFWAAVALGIVGGVASCAVAVLLFFAARPGPMPALRVTVDVPAGASAREVAGLLDDEGLVASETVAWLYLGLSAGDRVVPGEHLLHGGDSLADLEARLVRAPGRARVKVTIPEGFHRFAIAERLESLGVTGRDAFVRVSADARQLEALDIPAPAGSGAESAEGYLFPATYDLHVDADPVDVLARLVGESHKRWARLAEKHEARLAALTTELGWGRREVTILASMVEKEAAVDDERPTIAGVFFNRLRDPAFTPKLLQSDPTSGYGCLVAPRTIPACASFTGKITPALNRDKQNAYSTYVTEGLPPGPIASPGERSIEAVLAPAETRFFYFVAAGGGRHRFTETLAEHERAVKGP